MVTIDGEGVDWTGHKHSFMFILFCRAMVTIVLAIQAQTLSQMSAKDKSGLGYGSQIHDGVLSYENEVFSSVFDSRSSDVEDSPVNDRFAKVDGMHAVPPHMTGNYMPPKSNFGIDESKFTYGPKKSTTSKSDAKTSDLDSCDSSSSGATLETVPKLVESKPKVVNEPKVWSDAPIIEEYELDSDDEYVSKASDNPHQTLKGKGIVDSRCSKHMTGNKAYLVDYQDFNGGPIAFEGRKGQITVKGKIKTRKLDFEDVYFVKELQHFNLFSASQMCDKKNKVLFTDTECLVLSPDFKLPDENQILLRVPRQHNMYNFNLENIVPSRGLACLIAKATVDESTKWHMRLTTHVLLVTKESNTRPPAEAVSTACYVLNRVLVTKPQNKIPYELLTSKFEEKSDEGFLVRYSLRSKAFRVYNLETKRVEEKLHINFLKNKPNVTGKGPTWLFDIDYLTDLMNYPPITAENKANKTACPKETKNSAEAAKANSTNYVNTASTQVNTASTQVNTASITINTASTPTNQDDS
uniref:Ribonuclease H-like domain-containing protein n=1 Tax=Tanacetum cinerariifolium TaxID=118510 RepID=A0A6L2M6C1_TANCI|nr:ribonuclease H-like domain-containing protein [Tanacetum cinerariifolium]